MDREQQINEIQKVICQHCFEMTEEECANPEHMRFVKGEAEAYYDAGFRYKTSVNSDDFAEERKAWQKKRIELETTIAELKLEKEARLNRDFVKTAQKNAVKDAFQKIESRFAYYDDGDVFPKYSLLDIMGEILRGYVGTSMSNSVDLAQITTEQVKAQTIERCAKIIADAAGDLRPCYGIEASEYMQKYCKEFCEECCLKSASVWECWNEYLKTRIKEYAK